jgi:nucleoid-associated protein YgaU
MKKIIFLFIASVILCGWGVNASVAGDSVQYEVVTVDENDTLWDIAARRIDNTKDIRKAVYRIEQFNHISNPGALEPGMTIKIPFNLD